MSCWGLWTLTLPMPFLLLKCAGEIPGLPRPQKSLSGFISILGQGDYGTDAEKNTDNATHEGFKSERAPGYTQVQLI